MEQTERHISYDRLLPAIVSCIIVVVEVAISFNSVLLPNIKLNFAISDQLAQSTISLALFALGFSGILYGGIADSFGRKPVFLFAISLFCFASFLLGITDNLHTFLVAKFLQGFGSGAAWVVGNATLKDVYSGQAYVQVMNYVHAIAGISPAVAPVLGSYLGVIMGWRWCFHLISVSSFLVLLLLLFFQKETQTEKRPLRLRESATQYVTIFRERRFVKFLIVKVLAVVLLFAESTTIPLLFIDYMGVNPLYFGAYSFPVFACYVCATLLSMRFSSRYETEKVIHFGLLSILVSNVLVLGLVYSNLVSPVTVQLCKALSYFGWGFIFGNATAMIVSSVPGRAGVASAIMIALEMLFSSLGICLLSVFFDGTITPLSVFFVGLTLAALAAMRLESTAPSS